MFTFAATVVVMFVAGLGSSSAQGCLHGASEAPAERARRQQALRLAHQVNLAEAATQGRYRPLAALTGVPGPPPGFDVKLSTDGATYAFSIKDKLDPCGFSIFSDQDGLVYIGTPSREVILLPVQAGPGGDHPESAFSPVHRFRLLIDPPSAGSIVPESLGFPALSSRRRQGALARRGAG